MTVLEIVKARMVEDSVPTDDVLIMLSVEEVEQAIKNYCNLDSVPEELKFVWANMTIELIRYHNASVNGDDGNIDSINASDVSSLKIGDTTVTLGSGSTSGATARAIKSHRPTLDDIVMNNKSHLRKFRRMVW